MQRLREVTKTGMQLALVTAACRTVSAAKELLVAAVLGATAVTDAYWLAMLLPLVVMGTLGMAVRTAYLAVIPHPTTGDAEFDGQRAGGVAVRYLASLLAAALGISLLAAMLGTAFVGTFFPVSPKLMQQFQVSALLLACGLVVPMTMAAGLMAVLNSRQSFSLPQVTSLLPTAGVAVAVGIRMQAGTAADLLAGLLAGSLLQVVVLLWMVWRGGMLAWPRSTAKSCVGSAAKPTAESEQAKRIWRVALPLVLLGALAQMNVYVDRTMAGALPAGSVAVLSWSSLVRDFLSGTIIGSFLWALLPQLAQEAADGGRQRLWHKSNQILEFGSLVLLPLTAIVVIVCPVLLPWIELGAFEKSDALAVSRCVIAYSFGAFADLAGATMFQSLLVVGRLRTLLWLAFLASFLPNIALNLLLIGDWGEAGLAAATRIVAYCSLLAHYLALQRALGLGHQRQTLFSLAITLAAAAMMCGIGIAIVQWASHQLPATLAMQSVIATVAVAVGLAGYWQTVKRLPAAVSLRAALRTKFRGH